MTAPTSTTTTTPPGVFSIEGRGLKLDSAEDVRGLVVEPLERESGHWLEIRLQGNTFGLEACRAIAKCLRDQPKLKVSESAVQCMRAVLIILCSPPTLTSYARPPMCAHLLRSPPMLASPLIPACS